MKQSGLKQCRFLESKEHRKTILQNVKADIQDELEKGTSYHKILIKKLQFMASAKRR
ncbi:phage Terminase family protein [Staphylococcus aureus]|uniref:Phage Terminase family protein n=1 Tax=Staphylococcus aureus TaxID=1280 RepID=A0A380DV54_STAAU|nr:phage Terminase family protein [Staphylococcus aureus]